MRFSSFGVKTAAGDGAWCSIYSQAAANEMLGPRLLSLHNLRFLHRLVAAARDAISARAFAAFADDWAQTYFQGELPGWFSRTLEVGAAG